MCYGCWEKGGRPELDSPAIRRAVELMGKVYEFSGVGGNLHIVLDDWNIDDDDLDWCEQAVSEGGRYGNHDPEQLAAERECLNALRALTMEERHSAMAREWGFLS